MAASRSIFFVAVFFRVHVLSSPVAESRCLSLRCYIAGCVNQPAFSLGRASETNKMTNLGYDGGWGVVKRRLGYKCRAPIAPSIQLDRS